MLNYNVSRIQVASTTEDLMLGGGLLLSSSFVAGLTTSTPLFS